MSRNVAKSPRKDDRRVRRTREGLGDALVKLMHEKAFKAITVQNVLDQADVSRSTFYTHYSDKNDLFLSDVEDFFEGMASLLSRKGDSSNRIAAVREMFAHVAEWHQFYTALVASGKLHDVQEMGEGYFARGIDQRLNEVYPAWNAVASSDRAAVVHMSAGALLSLLSLWINRGMTTSPAEMDNLYHRMVWSGINDLFPRRPSMVIGTTVK